MVFTVFIMFFFIYFCRIAHCRKSLSCNKGLS